MTKKFISSFAAVAAAAIVAAASVHAQQTDMTFFITSVGKGKGADLGGLAGADAHCVALAKAARFEADQLESLSEHDDAERRRRRERA